jgi:MscS family membrane protein
MPTTRKDFYFVNLDDFSAYGIKVQIYLFFHVPDWSTEIQEKHKIIKEILQIAQKHKITFAVPPVIKED